MALPRPKKTQPLGYFLGCPVSGAYSLRTSREQNSPLLQRDFGRPTKELYTALGVLLLQEVLDLTDEETVSQLAFNLQWHYALDIVEESDEAKYLCPKTLWNMRELVIENHLDDVLFECTTEVLAKVFKVDTSAQRIDSVHIKSNMRRLGRIGIFVKSIHNFLTNLKRHHQELFDALAQDLVDRYLKGQSPFLFFFDQALGGAEDP
jgi:hypothetical protein